MVNKVLAIRNYEGFLLLHLISDHYASINNNELIILDCIVMAYTYAIIKYHYQF